MRYSLVAALLIVALMAPSPRVSIVHAPAIVWEDQAVRIMVQVEPDIDRGDVVQSSQIQLDGEQARKTHWIEWRRVPAGESMTVTAAVFDGQSQILGRSSRLITVLSRR